MNDVTTFWSRVKSGPGACMTWTGPVYTLRKKNGDPIGYIGWNGKKTIVQRLSYMLAHRTGESQTPRLKITCGNSLCVNPDHIVPKVRRYNPAVGGKNRAGTLNRERADKIRELYKSGATMNDIGIMFGVTIGAISHIVHNLSYYDPTYQYVQRHRRVSKATVSQMRKMSATGMTQIEIGRALNISQATVSVSLKA